KTVSQTNSGDTHTVSATDKSTMRPAKARTERSRVIGISSRMIVYTYIRRYVYKNKWLRSPSSSRPRERSDRRAGTHWPQDRGARPDPRAGALQQQHRKL